MIPKLSDIKIGNKIELVLDKRIETENSGENNNSFVSQFEEIDKKGKKIVVLSPMKEGRIYPVITGSIVNVYFIHEFDLFNIKCVAKDRIRSNGIHLLVLQKESDIKRIQRREYFRFECVLDINYKEMDSNNEYKKGLVIDISGGGMCLVTNENIKKNSLLEFVLNIKGFETIKFVGKVVRVKLKSNDKKEFGIMYKSISNLSREIIIRYIFLEQRKLRKKGLI